MYIQVLLDPPYILLLLVLGISFIIPRTSLEVC